MDFTTGKFEKMKLSQVKKKIDQYIPAASPTLTGWVAQAIVPFNSVHGLQVIELDSKHSKIFLPLRWTNMNHLRSMHAIALALGLEFSAGILITENFDRKKFNFILKNLNIEYTKKAKSGVHFLGQFEFDIEQISFNEKGDADLILETRAQDQEGQIVGLAKTIWGVRRRK